jgi:hypothetical protein
VPLLAVTIQNHLDEEEDSEELDDSSDVVVSDNGATNSDVVVSDEDEDDVSDRDGDSDDDYGEVVSEDDDSNFYQGENMLKPSFLKLRLGKSKHQSGLKCSVNIKDVYDDGSPPLSLPTMKKRKKLEAKLKRSSLHFIPHYCISMSPSPSHADSSSVSGVDESGTVIQLHDGFFQKGTYMGNAISAKQVCNPTYICISVELSSTVTSCSFFLFNHLFFSHFSFLSFSLPLFPPPFKLSK